MDGGGSMALVEMLVSEAFGALVDAANAMPAAGFVLLAGAVWLAVALAVIGVVAWIDARRNGRKARTGDG